VYQNKVSPRLDHFAGAVLGDLGGDVADAADIDVAVFFREAQLGGQVFAHQVGIEQGYGTSPDLQELDAQNIGMVDFPEPDNPAKKMVRP
jgi:hypothetical protein